MSIEQLVINLAITAPFCRDCGRSLLRRTGNLRPGGRWRSDRSAAIRPVGGDFDGMQQRRLIRLIVPYSKTIFFIDKGEPLGTAAEWGSELDGWLNKGKKSELEHIRIDCANASWGASHSAQ